MVLLIAGVQLGMELNANLERLVSQHTVLESTAHELRNRPLLRFDAWVRIEGYRFASRVSIVVYACCFIISNATLAAALYCICFYISSRYWRNKIGSTATPNRNYWVQFANDIDGSQRKARGGEEASDQYSSRANSGAESERRGRSKSDEQADNGSSDQRHKQGDANGEAGPLWYIVLGVAPNASKTEITAAFREKMAKNHPDFVAKMDPEFQQLAEKRAKALNNARDEGLRGCKG